MEVIKSALKKFDWKGWASAIIPIVLLAALFAGAIYAIYLYGMWKLY